MFYVSTSLSSDAVPGFTDLPSAGPRRLGASGTQWLRWRYETVITPPPRAAVALRQYLVEVGNTLQLERVGRGAVAQRKQSDSRYIQLEHRILADDCESRLELCCRYTQPIYHLSLQSQRRLHPITRRIVIELRTVILVCKRI